MKIICFGNTSAIILDSANLAPQPIVLNTQTLFAKTSHDGEKLRTYDIKWNPYDKEDVNVSEWALATTNGLFFLDIHSDRLKVKLSDEDPVFFDLA